jgi:hypothetical protein
MKPVPEFIDPVFAKTSPKRWFSVIENKRFGLVFAKTGSIISGTGHIQQLAMLFMHEINKMRAAGRSLNFPSII